MTSINNEEETHLGRMVAFARMGLKIVPRTARHSTLGTGLLYMNGDGLKFEPSDPNQEPIFLTWEQFDNG